MAAGDLNFGTNITFTGEEAREGILEAVYGKPRLELIHTIDNNIVADKNIALMERFSKITLKDTGCGTGKSDKTWGNAEKQWSPVDMKVWLTPCWSDFKASFFRWGMGKGLRKFDLGETEWAEYIMDVLIDAVYEDYLRIAWQGDVNSDVYTGTGVLLNSSDIVQYHHFDGFFAQIADGVTGTSIPNFAITENAGASFAAQALTTDKSVTILRAMIDNADQRLKEHPNAQFVVTDSIFTDLKRYYMGKGLESTFRNLQNGISELTFEGYKVISMPIWDRYIRADEQDGTKYNLPHRAVLSTAANLRLGFDDQSALGTFEGFLDKPTELYHLRGAYMADVKVVEDYMVSAAGF